MVRSMFAALLLLSPMPLYAQSSGASVSGAGTTATYDCNGGPATIEGAGNTITFVGGCKSLNISGASNIVHVELAPGAPIIISGAGNRVGWTMAGKGAPRQRIMGADNRVTRAR